MTCRAAAIIIWGALIVLLFIGLFAPPIRNSIPSNMAASGWLSGGLFSMGVLSAGLFSIGIFSAGLFSVGVFSVGVFSVGIFSFGTFAVGVWAVGQFFIPWLKMKDKDTKQ
jgi:quaternary ammonium compound-resistance protein SugE